MKKIKTVVAVCLAVVTGASVPATFASASVETDLLSPYKAIMEKFNSEYGTDYEFATEVVLENEGSNVEEMTEFFISMSNDEFYDYLYDAYTSSEVESEFSCTEGVSCDNMSPVSPQTIVAQSTQRSYYSPNADNYFYATATWVSVDGANRYVDFVNAGISYDANSNHYALTAINGYSFGNYMQEMTVDYQYTRVSAYGIQQGNYYTSITYYAGVGTY